MSVSYSLLPYLQIREQFAGAHLSPEEVALRVLKLGESEAVKKESGTVQPGVKGSGVESGSEAARLQVHLPGSHQNFCQLL